MREHSRNWVNGSHRCSSTEMQRITSRLAVGICCDESGSMPSIALLWGFARRSGSQCAVHKHGLLNGGQNRTDESGLIPASEIGYRLVSARSRVLADLPGRQPDTESVYNCRPVILAEGLSLCPLCSYLIVCLDVNGDGMKDQRKREIHKSHYQEQQSGHGHVIGGEGFTGQLKPGSKIDCPKMEQTETRLLPKRLHLKERIVCRKTCAAIAAVVVHANRRIFARDSRHRIRANQEWKG